MTVIYIYLLDEGVDVWRSVPAHQLSEGAFLIDTEAEIPEGEQWRFKPGQKVRCRWRKFENGEGWEAVELVT